jgi:hypothetical protein
VGFGPVPLGEIPALFRDIESLETLCLSNIALSLPPAKAAKVRRVDSENRRLEGEVDSPKP